MFRFKILQWTLAALTMAARTQSVDIRIERSFLHAGEVESFIAATCLNIQPGECCKPPTRYPDVTTKVLFRHLLAWDIAAVWRDQNRFELGAAYSNTGCSGPLIVSRKGPGVWLWRQTPAGLVNSYAAEGASYIRLPVHLPPDPNIINSLLMQGLLGLVWSSGSWFASPAAEKVFGGQYEIESGGMTRRDIRSASMGNVYARPPVMTRYPGVVEINGTLYTAGQTGEFMYSDTDGNMANLTDWFVAAGR
ncbi:MAG: hypothetical protein Q9184_004232 [Pyrenodesmia sp. 2 TL-2023]